MFVIALMSLFFNKLPLFNSLRIVIKALLISIFLHRWGVIGSFDKLKYRYRKHGESIGHP